MPSQDEEDAKTPTKPKAPATPRRSSAAKRTPSGTPIRKKTSPAVKTPNTAPVRTKTGGKKVEATLLGDFLLGRPSPNRTGRGSGNAIGGGNKPAARRRSLAAVKRELRLEVQAVEKVPQPGGVKDRVKQWQKASAAAAAVVVENGKSEPEEDGDGVEDRSVGEEDRLRIKMREGKRPGRRKIQEEEDERGKQRSKSAPRKRVISDSHWMKDKKSPPRKTSGIPKDFLKATATNPPVERKIEDWVRRTENDEIVVEVEEEEKSRSRTVSKREASEETPRSRKVSRQADLEETPTKRKVSPRSRHVSKQGPPDDGLRVQPSRDNSPDDGIRIETSLNPSFDDGIRINPSRENAIMADDGVRIKPVRKEGSKRKPKEHDTDKIATPRKMSEVHSRPVDNESKGETNDWEINVDDGAFSIITPTHSQNPKRKERKSTSPESMDEIPFGNSAFSVLDLPVGAEAETLRRPPPKRNNSFGVPKVFKKIYYEGINIARDTVDPPRVGQHQPPSIESWLNGTTDPFVDRPSAPSSTLEVPDSSSRRQSFNPDDQSERDLTASKSRRKRRVRSSQDTKEDFHDATHRETSPLENKNARDTLPSMENSPPLSPTGLRRTPATRNTSSPKSARKLPLKDALLEAFRGESAPIRPKSFSNPLADISGMREHRSLPESDQPDNSILSDASAPKRSPRLPEYSSFDAPRQHPEKPLPAYPRRTAPTTGEHQLSTIASVESLSTSSATGTASELSQTTVTQATVLTANSSSLSRNSKGSGKGPGLKRRLTKHSDLVSMLSLPGTGAPGRAKSIRSARSVRTTRIHLESATVQDLMRELADDEVKYMRELKTLVDGVIPVLLTCVLSKSESAVSAGFFNPNTSDASDSSFTQPIVDMGIALERLKSLHKRIPLQDPHAFIAWAQTAHKTYNDYLGSWRMGFQDVVVNLAPASRQPSVEQNSTLDEMPRNADGDVLNSNGERADVQYMLKRPLVRAKYLSKIVKGIDRLLHSELSGKIKILFEQFEVEIRIRIRQEEARMVDREAYNTDVSRARDLRTMALAENVKIDRTRQVYAKDFFSLDLQHSNGQRLECRVELLLRDKPSDQNDSGDILICATDDKSRWLLFAPLAVDLVSARRGDHIGQMVVMARGIAGPQEWRECFLIETDDETITEWIEMLGTVPMPPEIRSKASSALLPLPPASNPKETPISHPADVEIPIGERRGREAEESASNRKDRRRTSAHMRIASTLPHSIKEESTVSSFDPRDLNEAMDKAGQTKRAQPARYHSRSQSHPSSPLSQSPLVSGDKETSPETLPSPEPSGSGIMNLPLIPKVRNNSAPPTPKSSTPLKESMRPELNILEKQQPSSPTSDSKPLGQDGAPPPPAHRVPTTPNTLKKTPILESPTPKAKPRRSSSPLKHEYQPSDASGTSSSSELSDSQDDGSYSESSDEELDAPELPQIQLGVSIYGRKISPQGSLYSLPNSTLAPSQSASQAPYQGIPVQRFPGATKKMTAMISSWSNKKGRWEDLWTEPCSIIISPGRIEAFEMTAAHSSPVVDAHLELSGGSDLSQGSNPDEGRPLISLELTPIVSLRQSTALDIEIQSPPRPESRLQCSGTVRYRAINVIDCQELYHAIHRARMENPKYKKLEEERMLNSFGTHAYESAIKGNRRRSWLGRKKSYRASTRAPSATEESEQSAGSKSSAFSALKRMSRGSFNIGKSSIENSQGKSGIVSGPQSMYSGSSSGTTPPHTPTDPSLAGTSMTNGHLTSLGSENLKIRLYVLATATKWDDRGAARLTITAPPPGMRQASSLYNGLEKRVLVTRKAIISSPRLQSLDLDPISENRETKKEKKEKDKPNVVLLDVILGANCFSRIGNNGIACNIWEDVTGDNGEVGTVGAYGGVSGRTRKWLFDTGNKRDADWIFGLLAMGR